MTQTERPRILVVDDTRANLIAMRRLLAGVDAEVVEADSGNAALAACLEQEFALILLDVNMPDMDGFEVAALLNEESHTRGTPIIFVTAAYADDLNRLKGYRFGAVDYIAKPVNDIILLSKVQIFLDLYNSRQALRKALSELSQRNLQLQREVAERQRAEEQTRHQATHDVLTGVPNRLLFNERLSSACLRAARTPERFALVYLDIDGFKPVNDRHGHTAGDALLVEIAERLQQRLRASDTVARLGGDEFALILEGIGDADTAMRLAREIGAGLGEGYTVSIDSGIVPLRIGASIGVALFPDHGREPEALIHAADLAMYEAKREARGQARMAGEPSDGAPRA